MEDEFKPCVQPQRRVNPNIKEVVKKKVIKVLGVGLIYPIYDSPWVSPVHVVQKKIGVAIVKNEKTELIPQRTVTGWRVLKALDEGYSSKNYVRKFLRALHHKWRAKVTAIEESKDLTSLSFDELIRNLKVHEMIIKKDFEIVKEKVERKSISLKAKKESSDEKCSTSGSEGEECGNPNHLIGECPKPPKDKNQRAFVEGSWSDSGEEDDEKVKYETCLVAHASSEVCWIELGEWEIVVRVVGCGGMEQEVGRWKLQAWRENLVDRYSAFEMWGKTG
nr:alpha/beta hydrolases superfamily protein [Tanacetum cinerariifolium]